MATKKPVTKSRIDELAEIIRSGEKSVPVQLITEYLELQREEAKTKK